MAENKIERYKRFIPPVYKPGINPVITALLNAWAESDDTISAQIQETKAQIFVRTANGQYLDRLASGLGISRPSELGLLDEDFQELVPNLSFKSKQIRKIFYDIMDIFWSPLFTHVNIQTINNETFNISVGDNLIVIVDGGDEQEVFARTNEIASIGAATAEEITVILNRLDGVTASVIEDQITGDKFVNLRTNTPGNRGSLQLDSTSTMIGTGKLELTVDKKIRITDLEQRAAVYEVRDRELIIEIPATIPLLQDTLKGSHHFHADATLEPPVAPANGIWLGSFLYSPTGISYTVTKQNAVTESVVQAGTVQTQITVDDASNIPDEPGFLIFNWGKSGEEQPVRYIGRPNDKTILLDPAHIFSSTHLIGSNVNVLVSDLKPFSPSTIGDDYAIYLPSPSNSRSIVQDIFRSLIAAGIVINFVILLPNYMYICRNPYTELT